MRILSHTRLFASTTPSSLARVTTGTRICLAILGALTLGGCSILDEFADDEPQVCRSTGNGPYVRCDRENTPRETRKPGDPHTLPNVAL
jgi:hypothetical protein